jgi:hypothetical protein
VEDAHAAFWRKRLAGVRASAKRRGPGGRTRGEARTAGGVGPELVLPLVN